MSAALVDVLARVLAEHRAVDGFHQSTDLGALWRNYACTCGWWSTADRETDFRPHVAAEQAKAVLAALVETVGAEGHHAVDTREPTYCQACDTERWPCPTARALADLTAALGGES